jgi:hypothetical protein
LISSSSHPFLGYQDFTFSADNKEDTTDFALHVSLFQDFLDPVSVDLIFEVLTFDGEYDQESNIDDPLPKCDKMCLVGA